MIRTKRDGSPQASPRTSPTKYGPWTPTSFRPSNCGSPAPPPLWPTSAGPFCFGPGSRNRGVRQPPWVAERRSSAPCGRTDSPTPPGVGGCLRVLHLLTSDTELGVPSGPTSTPGAPPRPGLKLRTSPPGTELRPGRLHVFPVGRIDRQLSPQERDNNISATWAAPSWAPR